MASRLRGRLSAALPLVVLLAFGSAACGPESGSREPGTTRSPVVTASSVEPPGGAAGAGPGLRPPPADGDPDVSLARIKLPDGPFKRVSMTDSGLCALRDPDGSLVCVSLLDGKPQGSPPVGRFAEVVGDGEGGCAADAGKAIQCWGGMKELAALAKGRPVDKVVASRRGGCLLTSKGEIGCAGELAEGAPKEAIDIDARTSSGACAILRDKRVACWAYAKTSLSGAFAKIAVAGWGKCALDAAGKVHCDGVSGVPEVELAELRGGFRHFCGTSSGELLCFGGNERGETLVPKVAVRAFDAAGMRTCWIAADGSLHCAGQGFAIGPKATGVSKLTIAEECGCTLQSNGRVRCFGTQCGLPNGALDGEFTSVSADKDSGCALGRDGVATCWGKDLKSVPKERLSQIDVGLAIACYRREKDGSVGCSSASSFRAEPKERALMTPPDGRFDAVEVGVTWACGLRTSGEAECWGFEDYSDNEYEWKPPPKGHRYVSLSVGYNHVCAITKEARDIECWGRDRFGETAPQKGPFLHVDAGEVKSCAVRADGELACWGRHDDKGALPKGPFESVAVEKYNDEGTAGLVCGVRPSGPRYGEVACGYY